MTSSHGEISGVFRDVLGIEPPPAHTDLIETGLLDSLMLVTLLAELEEAFSITIPLERVELDEIRTIAGLSGLVDRQRARAQAPARELGGGLVVQLREGTGGPPVFLVPALHGNPLILHPLAQGIRTTGPVYGLAAAGIGAPGAPVTVEEMAQAYAEAIRSLEDPSACVIGGVSFGGLVAFETARLLQAAGEPPQHVVLLDTLPGPRSLTVVDYLRLRIALPIRVIGHIRADPRARLPLVLGRGLRWAWRKSRGRWPGSRTATTMSPREVAADRAGRAYRIGSYDGDVTLMVTSRAVVRPGVRLTTFDPAAAWSRRITGRLAVQPIPGGHMDFLRDARLEGVASCFSDVLAALDPPRRPPPDLRATPAG